MYKDNQDRIDAYLRGEMRPEERAEFESDLKTDVELHNDFIETKLIAGALADRKQKLDMMARWDAEEELSLKLLQRKKRMRGWTIGMSAAACVAIGFFAVGPMFLRYPDSSVPEHAMPIFENESYYRGSDNSIEYLDSLIEANDYERALAYADSLAYVYDDELKQFELKDTLTEKEECNQEMCLEALEDIEWRRANILVALGRNSEAIECLKQIIEEDGIYRTQAESLLDSISRK